MLKNQIKARLKEKGKSGQAESRSEKIEKMQIGKSLPATSGGASKGPLKAPGIPSIPDPGKSSAPIIHGKGKRKCGTVKILNKKTFAEFNIPYDIVSIEGVADEAHCEALLAAFIAMSAINGVSPSVKSYGYSPYKKTMCLNVPHAKPGHISFIRRLLV